MWIIAAKNIFHHLLFITNLRSLDLIILMNFWGLAKHYAIHVSNSQITSAFMAAWVVVVLTVVVVVVEVVEVVVGLMSGQQTDLYWGQSVGIFLNFWYSSRTVGHSVNCLHSPPWPVASTVQAANNEQKASQYYFDIIKVFLLEALTRSRLQ